MVVQYYVQCPRMEKQRPEAGTPDQTSTNVQYPTHNNTGVSAEELGMVEADSRTKENHHFEPQERLGPLGPAPWIVCQPSDCHAGFARDICSVIK